MKKHISFNLIALLAILLAACGSPATPEPIVIKETVVVPGEPQVIQSTTIVEVEKVVVATPESPQVKEKVKLYYLSGGTADLERAFETKWIKLFNETHPNIEVEIETVGQADLFSKFQALSAAGTPPDLYWIAPSTKDLARNGLLEPLDDILGDSKQEYLDVFLGSESDVVYEGQMYGAPFVLSARALISRKDIMEEYGITPEDIDTFEEFLEVCKLVSDPPNRYCTTFGTGTPRWGAFMSTYFWPNNGVQHIADLRPEVKDNYIALLQFLKDLQPYMPPAQVGWDYAETNTAYQNGVTVFYPGGSWVFAGLKPLAPELMAPETTVVLPMPYGSGRSDLGCVVPMGGVNWGISAGSQHKEEVGELLRFLTTKEILNDFPFNLTPKKGITIDDRVRVSPFGEEVRWWHESWYGVLETCENQVYPSYSPGAEIQKIFTDEVNRLYAGQVTAEEAYENIKVQVEPILVTE